MSTGKRLGCFATIGGNPNTSKAKMWMRETSQTLATLDVEIDCRRHSCVEAELILLSLNE